MIKIMKFLNIAIGGGISRSDLINTLHYKLFQKLSNKPIKFSKLHNADLIFYGPYFSFYERILNKALKKIGLKKNFDPEILNMNKFKKNNCKKIFLTFENSIKFREIKADYYFTSFLGISDDNHLRIPYWKHSANWPEYNIFFDYNSNNTINRYGGYYEIEKLTQEMGDSFLKKNKSFCLFASHMMYPRKEIYDVFKKNFIVDGYGKFFDQKILNHNISRIKKRDILKKYRFNLCPHTFAVPGLYSCDISDAFHSNSLAVTWTEKNINLDFNEKSFINLIDYQKDNFREIIELLKDDLFLKKFTKEPLLLSKPNLEVEIKFIQRILNSI